VAQAPRAKLILYPQYPEVRLSGFLSGCPIAPGRHLRPIEGGRRRHDNDPDGRVLVFATTDQGRTYAHLAPAGSPLATELEAKCDSGELAGSGIFWVVAFRVPPGDRESSVCVAEERRTARYEVTVSKVRTPQQGELPLVDRSPDSLGDLPLFAVPVRSPRDELIRRLWKIHACGWHQSVRLDRHGMRVPYRARNGGGYTLEAQFGIIPNGNSEPDFLGWELKAHSGNRITLMTPEPDDGLYGEKGTQAFVRMYGHNAGGDTLYFTGVHRANEFCGGTGLMLGVHGFDAVGAKIVDVSGGLGLIDRNGTNAAGWTFAGLISHWGRKHAAAAFVPYTRRQLELPEYSYESPALLGEGTDFVLFLSAITNRRVFLDPGSKVEAASTRRPRVKARNQFRVATRHLGDLYRSLEAVPLSAARAEQGTNATY